MRVVKLISKKLRIECTVVIMLAVLGAFLTAYWPVLLSTIYDAVSSGEIINVKTAIEALLGFGAVFLAAELCSIVRRVWVDKIAVSYEKDLRDLTVARLLRIPLKTFSVELSGEYTAKVNQAVTGASQLIKVMCNQIVPSILIGTFTIAQVLKNAPVTIAGIFITYMILEVVISICQIRSQNGIREALVHKKANLDGLICQAISSIEMIRTTSSESYEMARLEPIAGEICTTEIRHHVAMGRYDAIKKTIKILYMVGILCYAIYLVSKGMISSGMVITIALLFQQLVVPIDELHAFMDETASAKVKTKKLDELVDSEEDPIFSRGEDIALPEGDICVENLTIYTPKEDKVVSRVNKMVIKAGEVTALVGPTGCGKSSIMKAIMGYYPSKGEISMASLNLEDISHRTLCDSIYKMTQEPVFIAGTVKENLEYGLETKPGEAELIDALKKAKIYDEFKQKEEDVLGIRIEENAKNFSGGQGQRLALARVFLRRPKWIFADEATANIDEATSLALVDTVKEYAHEINAGVLLISHQESLLTACDKVIKLNTNKLVA